MAWKRRWLGVGVIGLSGWLLTGCASDLPPYAMPVRSFAADISETSARPQVRSQVGDSPLGAPVKPASPASAGLLQVERPPSFMDGVKTPAVLVPPPPGTGVLQASLSSRGTVRVRVLAWVNGRPIFADEVKQAGGEVLESVNRLPDSQRAEKHAELTKAILEQIVDQELMYQDAVGKLAKVNPKALEKMKDYVDNEFDKTLVKMRQAKWPEERIKELEPTARRMMERNLISTEYARSRIMEVLKSRVNMDEVRDYYDTHKNEFRTVDKVVWQDIFIPISPNLRTIEEVRRFAEEEINKCRTPGDFDRLMVYNDGDSKLRGGEGLGQRLSYKDQNDKWVSGDIRPIELEPHLAKLREGEIGPVVPFPLGVHLIRVTKREYAGQMPLDDLVQRTITKKLESQLADREYRRIVRELRLRAMIEVEREMP